MFEKIQRAENSKADALARPVAALRTRYYWDTMKADTQKIVRTCDKYRAFADFKNTPSELFSPIMSPWIHATWGLDLIGKLPTAQGQYKYIIVAIDYFTMWVEAEP